MHKSDQARQKKKKKIPNKTKEAFCPQTKDEKKKTKLNVVLYENKNSPSMKEGLGMPAHQIVTIPQTFFLSVQMTAGAAEYTIRKILLNFTFKQKICFLIYTPKPQSVLEKESYDGSERED